MGGGPARFTAKAIFMTLSTNSLGDYYFRPQSYFVRVRSLNRCRVEFHRASVNEGTLVRQGTVAVSQMY